MNFFYFFFFTDFLLEISFLLFLLPPRFLAYDETHGDGDGNGGGTG